MRSRRTQRNRSISGCALDGGGRPAILGLRRAQPGGPGPFLHRQRGAPPAVGAGGAAAAATLARLFEPEAEARARVSAALRQCFQPRKAPRRSPVPPPLLSPQRIFFITGDNKNPYPSKISTYAASNSSGLSRMPPQSLRPGPSTVHGARKSVPPRGGRRAGPAARWGQVSPTRRRLALEEGCGLGAGAGGGRPLETRRVSPARSVLHVCPGLGRTHLARGATPLSGPWGSGPTAGKGGPQTPEPEWMNAIPPKANEAP